MNKIFQKCQILFNGTTFGVRTVHSFDQKLDDRRCVFFDFCTGVIPCLGGIFPTWHL